MAKTLVDKLRVNCSDQLSYRGNLCCDLYVARQRAKGKQDSWRKRFENDLVVVDNRYVITTKADNQRRIVVPQATPGQVYSVQENADGSLTLSLIGPTKMPDLKCRLGKEGGFTVAVPGQPIDERAIDEVLADFP